jgi:hypothetical protein
MEQRSKTERTNQSGENLWRRIYRALVIIVALVLTLTGLVGIIWVSSKGENTWHHIVRDVSIAAMVSGIVSIAYEYMLRNSFTHETQHQLAKLFKERYEASDLLSQAGINTIHYGLPAEVADEFRRAKHIRILQTWTNSFGQTDNIGRALYETARDRDVDIKILLLKPDSIGTRSRGKDLGLLRQNVPQNINNDLRDLKKMCEDANVNARIHVRLYDATPVMAIHGYDNTNVVGIYWQEEVSQGNTQFEVASELDEQEASGREPADRSNLHFSRAIDRHFNVLWKEKSEDAKKLLEWEQA